MQERRRGPRGPRRPFRNDRPDRQQERGPGPGVPSRDREGRPRRDDRPPDRRDRPAWGQRRDREGRPYPPREGGPGGPRPPGPRGPDRPAYPDRRDRPAGPGFRGAPSREGGERRGPGAPPDHRGGRYPSRPGGRPQGPGGQRPWDRDRRPPPPAQQAQQAPQPREERGATPWDRAAGWYDSLVGEHGGFYHQEVIIPRALALLELKTGERALDVGAGQGVFSRALKEAGARVTAVDSSERLIRMAREHGGHGIQYFVGDARQMLFLDSESFDIVACLLSLQNMNPIAPVIAECARVLKPDGRMVIVLNHPCFRIPRQSGWGWEEERKLQFRRIDRYMTEMKVPIQTHPGDAPEQITWTYHLPLSGYVRALSVNGLYVDALEEWTSPRESQPGPRASAENMARQEIPLFLALRAVKLRQPERAPIIITAEPEAARERPAEHPSEAAVSEEKKPRRRATTRRTTRRKAPGGETPPAAQE